MSQVSPQVSRRATPDSGVVLRLVRRIWMSCGAISIVSLEGYLGALASNAEGPVVLVVAFSRI